MGLRSYSLIGLVPLLLAVAGCGDDNNTPGGYGGTGGLAKTGGSGGRSGGTAGSGAMGGSGATSNGGSMNGGTGGSSLSGGSSGMGGSSSGATGGSGGGSAGVGGGTTSGGQPNSGGTSGGAIGGAQTTGGSATGGNLPTGGSAGAGGLAATGGMAEMGGTSGTERSASFTAVVGVFQEYCVGCHGGNNTRISLVDDADLYLRLTTPLPSTVPTCEGTTLAVAENRGASFLLQKVMPNPSCGGRMPASCSETSSVPRPCLADDDIQVLTDWIDNGAPD